MLSWKRFWVLGWVLGRVATAQPETDTIRTYVLDPVVITLEQEQEASAQMSSVHHVSLAELAVEDAVSISEIANLLPGVSIQTNSRGETLLYPRGSGERQVAIFLDGALLTVPWDYRYDLDLIPTAALGGVTLIPGNASVLYGTNAAAGVLSLRSRLLAHPGRLTEVSMWGGAPAAMQASVVHLGHTGRLAYTVGVGYAYRRALALPDVDLPYSQPDPELRTNTDRRLFHVLSRLQAGRAGRRIGVTLFHMQGAQGVAPEGHLNPLVASVRYWRYPLQQHTLLIVSGEQATRIGLLEGAFWGSLFRQHIDQYRDVQYTVREAREEDANWTVGSRLVWRRRLDAGQWRLALNWVGSRHGQRIDSYAEADIPPRTTYYQQHLLSIGTELVQTLGSQTQGMVGISYDAMWTPETGDKPARDPMSAWSLGIGLHHRWKEGVEGFLAASRKVRFPTMRELFSEALGRFLVNPTLRPETIWIAEAGFRLFPAWGYAEIVGYINRTFDTIDQRTVVVDGKRKRQRVNLNGSRVYGIEARIGWAFLRTWQLEGHVAGLRSRALLPGADRPLTEKPAWLATLTLRRMPGLGLAPLVQLHYRGQAWALDETNQLQELPDAWLLHVRLAYRLPIASGQVEGFVRVNNVTNTATWLQLGLPGPGRELRLGVHVWF
ncbi:TonB-dependent receptor [Rhodothermus profundi]|uniref:Iron complex outermembrane recepter protein n=1 Tax=Rhodothermus profundi TaxID=633813 RepID=A0A1M6PFQ7_9BACT|nr:TonB-dependent receptor [Rhodothermus profundi]SHK06751.1 iron complex outermembrane recepter protein [Rhodothermus profundi]